MSIDYHFMGLFRQVLTFSLRGFMFVMVNVLFGAVSTASVGGYLLLTSLGIKGQVKKAMSLSLSHYLGGF
jgi:hypothetical protein